MDVCAALNYVIQVDSLSLGFALVSVLVLPLLQLVVPIMLVLWCCGRSILYVNARLFSVVTVRILQAHRQHGGESDM